MSCLILIVRKSHLENTGFRVKYWDVFDTHEEALARLKQLAWTHSLARDPDGTSDLVTSASGDFQILLLERGRENFIKQTPV